MMSDLPWRARPVQAREGMADGGVGRAMLGTADGGTSWCGPWKAIDGAIWGRDGGPTVVQRRVTPRWEDRQQWRSMQSRRRRRKEEKKELKGGRRRCMRCGD
jgi:hypothetical protein